MIQQFWSINICLKIIQKSPFMNITSSMYALFINIYRKNHPRVSRSIATRGASADSGVDSVRKTAAFLQQELSEYFTGIDNESPYKFPIWAMTHACMIVYVSIYIYIYLCIYTHCFSISFSTIVLLSSLLRMCMVSPIPFRSKSRVVSRSVFFAQDVREFSITPL